MNNPSFNKDQKNEQPMMGRANARFANKVRPKSLKETIKRLIITFQKERKILLLTVLSVLIATSCTLLVPLMVGKAIDAIDHKSLGDVKNLALILLFLYCSMSFFNWFAEFTVAKASQNMINQMRKKLFRKLERLSLSYFDQKAHGDIMSRFTNDLDAISNVISQSTITFLSSIYTVFGAVVIMLYLNVYMTLGVMFSVPLIFLLSRTISKRTIEKFKGQQKAIGSINGSVEETVYGLNIIQSYHQEAYVNAQFNINNELAYTYGKSAQIWSGLLMPIMNVINNLTFAIVGFLGGYLALHDVISVGVVASFIAYSRQFVRPLNELASIYNNLMSAVAGAERVFEVFDEVEEVRNDEGLKLPLKGEISFKDVSFEYEKNQPVVSNINITIKAGQKVAIVGPTGAGKTTLVNLLSNFYQPLTGQIYVDGHDIKTFNYGNYINQFGIVMQDSYLFGGTIYENILYGNLKASEKEVIEAAQMARVDSIIRRLNHGYDTKLTYGGLNLSHGERQLITIARAILADPKILVLDEATSSVDLKTEKSITKAMTQLMSDRTSVIIAHRLSTIKDADLILVMKDGKIIEQGCHEELVLLKGFYFEMVHTQL